MIRAILWKEYREHRAIWLTLAMVGAAGLYGLSRLMAPAGAITPREGPIELVVSVAVLFAWAYGLVCGSMILAGEREGATMTFLDMMPMGRLQLWLMKCGIGLVFLLGQVIVLFVFLIGLGITGDRWQTGAGGNWQAGGILLALLLSGIVGMSWGLLFSSRCENVLNAIGLAIGAQFVSYLVVGVLSWPVGIALKTTVAEDVFPRTFRGIVLGYLATVLVVLTVGPIISSARIFSRTDRLRGSSSVAALPSADISTWASWSRLLWLSYTQMRRLIIGLILFALGLGCLLPVTGPVAWPILTLFIGVLCGVTVCDDEQAHGSIRLFGDQRFPLRRVWLIKLGMRFALAVFAAFMLMLPSLYVTIFHRMESQLPAERQPPFFGEVLHSYLIGPVVPLGVHLTIWLMYGFSVGQLSALLFRKSVVAAVVSLGVSALLVSLWLPSLLGMGLHFWQITGVPLVLLLMAWTLVPAWAANRLRARRTFVGLGATFLAVALLIAVGLWYRVAEVPDLPDQWDMPAFVAGIPSPEENKAGQIIRSVCTKIDARERSLRQPPPNPPNPRPEDISLQGEDVLANGWPENKPELAEWLNAMFQGNWLAELAELPDLPLGVVEDPRRMTMSSTLPKLEPCRLLGRILAARGLQRQAAGHDAVFADNLRISLALSRNLQHDAPLVSALFGRSIQRVWLSALDRWLEKLRGHPQLLERVLRTLLRHEAETPNERESWQAEYLSALNTLEETPEQLLNAGIENRIPQDAKLRQAEFHAAALAWQFPWERERHRRIVRVIYQDDPRQRREVRDWGGILFNALGFNLNPISRSLKHNLALLHVSQLKVALRLYQAETGKPATTLDVLVPRYLPAIPVDPFDGQPFRYRLSKGERLQWDSPINPAGGAPGDPTLPPTRFVPEGQGILWSVGEYLVPLPAK